MRHRLLSLEASRFVAALLVACFHFSYAFVNLRGVPIFDLAFRGGHAGVEFFFVLSGFIIFFIHRDDMGRPSALRSFALKRFIRLYPMFWLIWAALLIGFLAPTSVSDHRSIAFGDLMLDGLLLPTNGGQILQQSWTLRHEIVFYAFFAVAIWNLRIGTAALILWQVAVLVIGMAYPNTLPRAVMPLFYIYNIGFGLGILTGWAASRWRPARPGLIALAGIVAFAACLTAEWSIGRSIYPPTAPLGEILSPLLYLASSAVIIFGTTTYEMRRPLPWPSALRLLGGCSYVLYLIHATVGSVVIRLFGSSMLRAVPNALVFLAMILASVLGAVALHLWIEQPTLRFLRRRFLTGLPPSHNADTVSGQAMGAMKPGTGGVLP